MWPEREKITQATWTSPLTSRLLFEAGVSSFSSKWGGYTPPGSQTGLVAVTEQSTAAGVPVPNFTYRGWASTASNNQQHNIWRASLAYVTGAHNFKVGYQAAYEVYRQYQNLDNPLAYTFNTGVPTQFTMRIGPHIQSNRTRYDGFYAQDQWTRGRLTLQGAVRYEHAWSWFPEGENGILADGRFGNRFIFPRQDGVTGFHDITPRMGAAYDLFGNGKTSVKVNFSKYLETAQNGGLYTQNNPAVTFQQTTTRSWTDGNGNFVPDCDLMNPAAAEQSGNGRRQLRRLEQLQLRQPVRDRARRSRGAVGVGCAEPRLAVRRGGAARDPAARGARRELQPALVGQLLRHRQPGDRSAGLRPGDDRRSGQREAAAGRRLSRELPDPQCADGAGCDRQLLHLGEQLRRRDGLLARCGRAGQRAGERSDVRAARRQRRPRRPRLLRDRRQAAGTLRDRRCALRQPAGRTVRRSARTG